MSLFSHTINLKSILVNRFVDPFIKGKFVVDQQVLLFFILYNESLTIRRGIMEILTS